jgi:hypothetical protein
VFLRPAAAQPAPEPKAAEAHRAAEYKVVAFFSEQENPLGAKKEFAKKTNQQLHPEVGRRRLVTVGRAFHWMDRPEEGVHTGS